MSEHVVVVDASLASSGWQRRRGSHKSSSLATLIQMVSIVSPACVFTNPLKSTPRRPYHLDDTSQLTAHRPSGPKPLPPYRRFVMTLSPHRGPDPTTSANTLPGSSSSPGIMMFGVKVNKLSAYAPWRSAELIDATAGCLPFLQAMTSENPFHNDHDSLPSNRISIEVETVQQVTRLAHSEAENHIAAYRS